MEKTKKILSRCLFILSVSLLIILIMGSISDSKEIEKVIVEIQPEIKVVIPETNDILAKIAWCESNNEQFDSSGQPTRGKINPYDVGKYQINESYHLADSIRLGYDILTLEGNTGYALHLYRTQGTTPWNWSKHCWSDPNRVWTKKDGMYWSV